MCAASAPRRHGHRQGRLRPQFPLPTATRTRPTTRTFDGWGEEKKKYDAKTNQEKAVAQEVARRVEGLTVTVAKKAGEGDVLYGSVTAAEIADALAQQGIDVDRRRIEVAEPIKRLGSTASTCACTGTSCRADDRSPDLSGPVTRPN